MINAAIVGLGWWGKALVEAAQGRSRHLRFTRGISRHPDAVGDFVARHGLVHSTNLASALADPGVQAVVLATPHSLHAEQIVQAAAAGKAVFCEKPLTLTRDDAVRAVEACRRAAVVLALGTNKRFWPSMQALQRIVAEGTLGQLLHIEGHFSNENSARMFAGWRASPDESPAGGMTGTGIHVLDAFINLMGPIRRLQAQLVARKPAPDPLDSLSFLCEFANQATGMLATVRTTPHYWRVHVFGRGGSAEAIGESELNLRRSGAKLERLSFPPVDTLLAELDAFADAVEGRASFPIPTQQMIETVAAFEAVNRSLASGASVAVAGN